MGDASLVARLVGVGVGGAEGVALGSVVGAVRYGGESEGIGEGCWVNGDFHV